MAYRAKAGKGVAIEDATAMPPEAGGGDIGRFSQVLATGGGDDGGGGMRRGPDGEDMWRGILVVIRTGRGGKKVMRVAATVPRA